MRGKLLDTYYKDYYIEGEVLYSVEYTQYTRNTGIRFIKFNTITHKQHEGEILTPLKLEAVSTCHEYVLDLINEKIKGK